MVDLFSGLGGASAAMVDRGWRVVRLDGDPGCRPDVVADVRRVVLRCQPDLLWASPPCVEFSREDQPWTRTGRVPSLALVEATYRWVDALRPRYWILENVRGAQRWVGPARQRFGPVYLWGNFPLILAVVWPWKARLSGRQRAQRAQMPYELSVAVAASIEGVIARRLPQAGL